jgi:outer membrane protein assembly factor BamD (BamD/ComL family)
MRILFTLLLLLFSASIVYGQEKKIKKAIEALSENNYTEYNSLLNDYVKEAPEVPLAAYALSLGFTKPGSPSYDLEKGFKKLQSVKDWLNANEADKGWCKSFGLCAENIQVQIDSIAITALRQVEQNKTDEGYQKFIKSFTNTPINDKAILSYHHWKFELASSANTVESLESFIKQFPNAQDVSLAKAKIERIEYIQTVKSDEISQFEAFLKKYPSSIHRSELQQKLIDLEFKQCTSRNDKSCFNDFLKKYPNSSYTAEVKIKIEEIDFSNAKKASSKEPLEAFIRDYPNSKYIEEAKKKLDELVNGVVIVSTGQGNTEDEAKQSALRSAIEQTFGAFISSKTEILNDQIISDQITSLSAGNIRSFEIINSVELPTGGYSTTLKAIISIDKLTSFVQSKGVQVEFKGGLFAMNVKQQLLNEKAEIEIVTNVVGTLHNLLQQSFDYSLEVSEPKSKEGGSDLWEVPMLINIKPNKNMDFCANYVKSNLTSISLSNEEKKNYEKLNKPVYELKIKYGNSIDTIYLRTKNALESFERFANLWFYTHSFYIENGIRTFRDVGKCSSRSVFYCQGCVPGRELNMEPLYTNNSLQFIKSNLMQNQIIYEYTDRLKLSDLERISKYEIFQDTIRNEYKNGGYQIKNLRENTNFILSPNPQLVYVTKKTKGYTSTDQTYFEIQTNADSILKNYNNCVYNGYSDWRLASAKEIESFVDNYVQNNFDNVMFKEFEFYFDMDDPELKLIYERPYQSGNKYHWARRSDNCKFLSSSMKNQLNEIGESREYNILCYFDQFIAHIKERDSDDFPKNPLQGQYFHKTNRITDVVLLFIVRSNNN